MELKHKITTSTELHNDKINQHSCFLASGETVLYASKTGCLADSKFLLCDRHGNQTKTLDPVRGHHPMFIKILPVTISNKEYLCVACGSGESRIYAWIAGRGCGKIYLLSITDEDKNPPVCYSGEVGAMCNGEPGTLYTADTYSGKVSILDCTTTDFKLKHTLNTSEGYVSHSVT